jgi:hypothetical protein
MGNPWIEQVHESSFGGDALAGSPFTALGAAAYYLSQAVIQGGQPGPQGGQVTQNHG